jgi:hypothetical protein
MKSKSYLSLIQNSVTHLDTLVNVDYDLIIFNSGSEIDISNYFTMFDFTNKNIFVLIHQVDKLNNLLTNNLFYYKKYKAKLLIFDINNFHDLMYNDKHMFLPLINLNNQYSKVCDIDDILTVIGAFNIKKRDFNKAYIDSQQMNLKLNIVGAMNNNMKNDFKRFQSRKDIRSIFNVNVLDLFDVINKSKYIGIYSRDDFKQVSGSINLAISFCKQTIFCDQNKILFDNLCLDNSDMFKLKEDIIDRNLMCFTSLR